MSVRFSNKLVAELFQPFWAALQAGECLTRGSPPAELPTPPATATTSEAGTPSMTGTATATATAQSANADMPIPVAATSVSDTTDGPVAHAFATCAASLRCDKAGQTSPESASVEESIVLHRGADTARGPLSCSTPASKLSGS
jgi:hypothetical protein